MKKDDLYTDLRSRRVQGRLRKSDFTICYSEVELFRLSSACMHLSISFRSRFDFLIPSKILKKMYTNTMISVKYSIGKSANKAIQKLINLIKYK